MGRRNSRRSYGFMPGRKRSLPQGQHWPEESAEGEKRRPVEFVEEKAACEI